MKKILAAALGVILLLCTTTPIAKSTTTYSFTPQYTEPCTGLNTKPLPSPWVSVGIDGEGQLPTYDEIQILGFGGRTSCMTTTEVQDDGQATLSSAAGVSTTNQYITYTIEALLVNGESVVWTYLRSGPFLLPSYALAVFGTLGTSTASYEVTEYEPSGGQYNWNAETFPTLKQGDTITFAISGTELYIFQNGAFVASYNTSAIGSENEISSGTVGIQIDALGGGPPETRVNQIVAGQFTVTH